MTKIFYRTADAVILTYSINSRETFDHLEQWMEDINNQCYPDVLVFMIGNKLDLES